MTPPDFSDEEYRLFRSWLREEYGLRFGPEKRDVLRTRLESRRAELGFRSYQQLYFHLKFHPSREQEREKIISQLTNNESYFFRERGQLEVLRKELLPLLKRSRAKRREVRLLSAGCSAGQEPYSLFITARESKLFPPPWRVRITGLDVDAEALARARRGVYGEHSFRGVAAPVRERYFRKLEEGWEILPELRRQVRFQPANLAKGGWLERLEKQDVIFCRNVLIYFDPEAARGVVERLHRVLASDGFLFLGHAETLSRIAVPFEVERRPGAIFYRKVEG